jgi:hypothetical protein
MRSDDAEILKMFRSELKFLEDGGYGHSPRLPWHPSHVFEESPTCLNFGDPTQPHPCRECALINFVPSLFRLESAPCRFIPLTDTRETSYDSYRSGTQVELEEALACWLNKQIGRMAKQQTKANGTGPGDREDESARPKETGQMQAA